MLGEEVHAMKSGLQFKVDEIQLQRTCSIDQRVETDAEDIAVAHKTNYPKQCVVLVILVLVDKYWE